MALDDFLQRFKTMMDALMAHPQVRLTHVWIGPGASDGEFETLARAWKRPVPAALETLYRQANGLQLRWVDTAHETYDPARDDRMSFERCEVPLYDVPGFAAGLLELPTLAELGDRDWLGEWLELEDAHLQHAVVFESVDESEDAVLFLDSPGSDPRVVVASDHLADIPEPGERTLSSYLDHLLSTWCSVWHRHEDAPHTLQSLTRVRVPIDPTRLVGQRVFYVDEGRGHAVMHGRVESLANATAAPRWWAFGPTLAQVEDDFGELIHVPMRSLFPPGPEDGYERLRDDPEALLQALSGSPSQVFEALAPCADGRHRLALPDGPAIYDAAWPLAALCARVPPALLVSAADTLVRSPETHTSRPVRWNPHRPRRPLHPTSSFNALGLLLFDVLLLSAARQGATALAAWLGASAAAQLRALLKLEASRDRLRGYDPLADRSKPLGYLQAALDGAPIHLDVGPRNPQRGTDFGLAALRLIRPADYASPAGS